MLDALMGSDRNASLPSGAAYGADQQTSGGTGHDGHHGHSGHPGPYRRKRSCYDPAVCPLHCAWGTDLHELFTNTKSDIGPNPRTCDDDAREEYLALPAHEQERLGFEYMLYDRLRDLVRGCDRIVNRNKDKLRQEVARQQRARSGNASGSSSNVNMDDPAANISEDKVRKVAEDRARLELIEEDIARMVQELEGLDEEEKAVVGDTSKPKEVGGAEADEGSKEAKADTTGDANEEEANDADANTNANEAEAESTEEKKDDGPATSEGKAEGETKESTTPEEESSKETKDDEEDTSTTNPTSSSSLDDETKAKLAEIRSKKRSILTALSSRMEQILPLRDAIESDTRHLHYFRSNHTIDKCVCEVSGNFMSFRDADERIAANYAGKQYVGWKMVRDKLDELKKKFGSGGPPPARGPPPGGYGPPSSRDHRRGGGGGGRRRDRSRSRERNRDRHRGGGGRRRSPDRWERDRAPRDWDRSRGGGRRDRW